MTIEEAKFILSAYRPNGSDAGLPAFGDALRMAAGDPGLEAWFTRSRAYDEAVARKLRQIVPPPGLREAILAGARASDAQRSRAPGMAWIAGLAAAAALVIVVFSMKAPARPETGNAALAAFAINDMVHEKHGGRGEPASALVAELETKGARIPGADRIDFEKLGARDAARLVLRVTRSSRCASPATRPNSTSMWPAAIARRAIRPRLHRRSSRRPPGPPPSGPTAGSTTR